MTFIPEVQTKTDTNNSTTENASTFVGSSTVTTGYNTIILTIQASVNSSAGGIIVYMSEDNSTWTQFYTDTYLAPNIYTKSFTITNKYWKLNYTSSSSTALKITSRLSTQLDTNSNTTNNITVFDGSIEASLDAFGKLRVTNPYTLMDLRFPSLSVASGANSTFLQNNQQVCTKSVGSFTGTYGTSKAILSGTGIGYYMTQTRNYCVYQPGKSLLFMASAKLDPENTNFITRLGYFDSEFNTDLTKPTVNNGLYFEISAGVCSIHVKNNTNTTYLQSEWNIDKMDGSGPSGLDLDFTKTQLFVIDMEWLGVGRIRYGFYAYGQIRYCHQVTNINVLIEPYTNTINLPISHQIICNTAGETGSMTQICSTVISEGGYNPIGRPFTVSNNDSTVEVSISETPLIAIRGGGVNYYHQNIVPTGISIIDTSTNNNLLYRLRIYLAGDSPSSNNTASFTTFDSARSVVQYSSGTNIVGTGTFQTSNSIILDQGYFYGRGTIAFNSLSNVFSSLLLQVTSDIDLTSDILVLTAEKIGTSTTPVLATISWQEIY